MSRTAVRRTPSWTYRAALRENASAPLRIDRDKGVIYGVKVLGRRSPNSHGAPGADRGTEYTDAAMRDGLPLYEGASVKTDHPAGRNAAAERSVFESFGVLRDCRVAEDGIRGDLHYYKSHPLAERVLEDIERCLGQYGLSHNAQGEGKVVNGVYLIEHIAEVRSVDLVDRPATNRNLWESVEMPQGKKITVKALLESQRKRFSKVRQGWLGRLLEMDDYGAPMAAEMDEPEAATDPDEALKDGFEAAILAVVQNDEMDAGSKAKKIAQLLKTHEKLTADPEPEPVEESEDDGDDDKKKETDASESREAKVKRREAALDLCESMNFIPTATQRKALVALDSDADRKVFIKEIQAAAKPNGGRPRSQSPGGTTTTTVTESEKIPDDAAKLASWLRG